MIYGDKKWNGPKTSKGDKIGVSDDPVRESIVRLFGRYIAAAAARRQNRAVSAVLRSRISYRRIRDSHMILFYDFSFSNRYTFPLSFITNKIDDRPDITSFSTGTCNSANVKWSPSKRPLQKYTKSYHGFAVQFVN